jgi:hypothetical protein
VTRARNARPYCDAGAQYAPLRNLLICGVLPNEISIPVLAVRVVVRPMDSPAQICVNILSAEFHPIPDGESLHAGRNVNVMSDQQCLTAGQLEDKSLVARPFIVICE